MNTRFWAFLPCNIREAHTSQLNNENIHTEVTLVSRKQQVLEHQPKHKSLVPKDLLSTLITDLQWLISRIGISSSDSLTKTYTSLSHEFCLASHVQHATFSTLKKKTKNNGLLYAKQVSNVFINKSANFSMHKWDVQVLKVWTLKCLYGFLVARIETWNLSSKI